MRPAIFYRKNHNIFCILHVHSGISHNTTLLCAHIRVSPMRVSCSCKIRYNAFNFTHITINTIVIALGVVILYILEKDVLEIVKRSSMAPKRIRVTRWVHFSFLYTSLIEFCLSQYTTGYESRNTFWTWGLIVSINQVIGFLYIFWAKTTPTLVTLLNLFAIVHYLYIY